MVAPSLTERDASAADSLSSERSRPASPLLRTNPPAGLLAPSTSSENRRARAGWTSAVFIAGLASRDYSEVGRVPMPELRLSTVDTSNRQDVVITWILRLSVGAVFLSVGASKFGE